MNATIQAAIDAGLADLTRVVSTPSAPFGYGVDLSCAGDLDETCSETDPNSTVGIGQAIARRWDCPRGALPIDAPDASEYGEDVRGWLNVGITERDLASKRDKLRAEALKDDRVRDIAIKFTRTQNGGIATITIAAYVTPADPGLRPFDLVVAVTSADFIVQAIGGAAT